MKTILIVTGLFGGLSCLAQDVNKTIQQGNILYRQEKYDQAEIEYNNAVQQEPSNNTARFNLGNAVYRRGKQTDAIKVFERIAGDAADPDLKSKAYYNEGVVLSVQKKLEESIEAYKNALRRNPGDQEARENLQKALLELKKKEPPKKKENDQKKKQQQQQQKQQQQPKMNKKEAEQRLKLLEQKEKEVQQRLQKEKSKSGGSQKKDW
jgi:Ca-activated chloride channel family protein